MNCPFCKKKVSDEAAAIHGCMECIERWRTEQDVDHPVG